MQRCLFEGTQSNALGNVFISQKDEFGEYYTFYNLNHVEVKYHFDNPTVKFEYSLNKVEDIPTWCKALSNHLRRWKFDDITAMKEPKTIDATQNMIIKDIITGSISDELAIYDFEDKDGVDSFLMIQDELRNLYTRSNKDRMWMDSVIDDYCSDTIEMVKKLMYMCQLEIWSSDEENRFMITSKFLKEKMIDCLTKEAIQAVMNANRIGVFPLPVKDATPMEFIRIIQ